MSSILELSKKLNKEFNSTNLLQISNVIPQYKRLKSRAFGMLYPLFGGLPYGRICVYSGKQHSGKTTAAFNEIANYQRENPDKYCLFVDVEHSLDLQFQCAMNGVNQDKLIILDPEVGMSGEEILSIILEMQLNADDIGMIVIDSIAALDTAQNLKSDFEKDNGKRGSIAAPLHKFCKEISASLSRKQNIIIFINQVRVKDTTFTGAPIYSEPGGDGPKFYSSVSVRFGTRVFMKGEDEISGENSGEGADGFRLKFTITKNKTANTSRGGGFITYRYETGIDWLHDLLDIALKFNFINRVNNVTYELMNLETGEIYQDENGNVLRGKKATLIDYIFTHKEFQDAYVNMLINYVSASNTQINILDDKAKLEIAKEEENVVEE